MAFQSLNILGSLGVAPLIGQRESVADRERAEAYRSQLRDQVQLRNRTSVDDVDEVESHDRMQIGDAPQQGTGGGYEPAPRSAKSDEPAPELTSQIDSDADLPVGESTDDNAGTHLDVVI